MINLITSIILASLLIPSGFNFLIEKAVDYSYVEPNQEINSPQRIINNSFGLKTTASSVVVVDNDSGAVLYNKNSLDVTSIASITKLMTALVFLETNPDFEKVVEIIDTDQQDGGLVRLLIGEQVKVKDLFYLMLVSSTNEAASALARTTDVENFVGEMNKYAAELGMTDTYFLGPSGIEVENVSSPKDLLKLANAAFERSVIIEALSMKEYSFETFDNQRPVRVFNTNKLLDSFLNTDGYKIVGAKTGYLDEAGYCLLIRVEKEDGRSLTIVLLGSETIDDRWQETKGLVDWIFQNYEWPSK